jgi:hypothetical protein
MILRIAKPRPGRRHRPEADGDGVARILAALLATRPDRRVETLAVATRIFLDGHLDGRPMEDEEWLQ